MKDKRHNLKSNDVSIYDKHFLYLIYISIVD